MTAATVSGPSNRIASSIASAAQSGSRSAGQRYEFVFGTWRPLGTSGSKVERSAVMPVAVSAPNVVPWYAVSRAISLVRFGWPVSLWYWRTSLNADSTASEPPDVKKTRFRSPGASSAIFAASSIARGCA